MTDISDSLRLLFETSVERDGDRYVVSIPSELVESGSISTEELYRVALLSSSNTASAADSSVEPTAATATETPADDRDTGSDDRVTVDSASAPSEAPSQPRQPPVAEGDVRTVIIDTLGDQGDGIAKVERGFVIIVPGTDPGDRVEVEVTDVKQTVAFAEPVDGSSIN
ncbi:MULTISPECIES: TRAM domain-containing protein [Haloferax]|uniref:Translation initiation factor IF-2 subunit beta n=1 Tax=Haloferax massiliensis TaxID=1476858 RepID=A0A0D6JUG5_9EURY|nr:MULTISPECIES: TRAM domain-containing protein [Haloferax]MDS0241695.1 TRAM domain-containing protein [Haloferax sp. S2CR25]MDS0444816.1 TRAM domain-containing protein [Haloferax sp. S2CR25-2]CQR52254.1 translation initiation factor IF-2 subunit beta [Haloferax massiliensis]